MARSRTWCRAGSLGHLFGGHVPECDQALPRVRKCRLHSAALIRGRPLIRLRLFLLPGYDKIKIALTIRQDLFILVETFFASRFSNTTSHQAIVIISCSRCFFFKTRVRYQQFVIIKIFGFDFYALVVSFINWIHSFYHIFNCSYSEKRLWMPVICFPAIYFDPFFKASSFFPRIVLNTKSVNSIRWSREYQDVSSIVSDKTSRLASLSLAIKPFTAPLREFPCCISRLTLRLRLSIIPYADVPHGCLKFTKAKSPCLRYGPGYFFSQVMINSK